MNAGAWVGIASVGFTVVLQIVGCAFLFGGLFAKVRAMERALEGSDQCAVQLAAVHATLEGVQGGMDRLDHNVKNLWQALQERQTGSRRNTSGGS